MRLRGIATVLAATFTLAQPAWAQQIIASAESPDKVIGVEVQIDGGGKLGYAVKRRGKEVIGLGVSIDNAVRPRIRSTSRRRARASACAVSRGSAARKASSRPGSKAKFGGSCHRIGPSRSPSFNTPEARKLASGRSNSRSRSM